MKSKPPRKRRKEVGVNNFALLSGRVGVSVPVPIEGGGSACVGNSRSRQIAGGRRGSPRCGEAQ